MVLVDGELVFYVERGGKTLLSFTEDRRAGSGRPPTRSRRRSARGLLGKLTVERADGEHVFGSARGQRSAAGGRLPDDATGAAPAPVTDLTSPPNGAAAIG